MDEDHPESSSSAHGMLSEVEIQNLEKTSLLDELEYERKAKVTYKALLEKSITEADMLKRVYYLIVTVFIVLCFIAILVFRFHEAAEKTWKNQQQPSSIKPKLDYPFALILPQIPNLDIDFAALGRGDDLTQLNAWISYTNLDIAYREFLFRWTIDGTLRGLPANDLVFSLIPEVWHRPEGLKANNTVSDCDYKISRNDDSKLICSSLAFSVANDLSCHLIFIITQVSCLSLLNTSTSSRIPGGSSFEIGIGNRNGLAMCEVLDLFNGAYTVSCFFPIEMLDIQLDKDIRKQKQLFFEPSLTSSNNTACLDVTIVLEYEHYDSFSERRAFNEAMGLMLSVPDDFFCYQLKKTENETSLDPMAPTAHSYWGLQSGLVGPTGRNIFKTLPLEWREHGSFDLPGVSEFTQCLSEQPSGIQFIGSSHLRSFWDYIVMIYFKDFQMWNVDKRHSSGKVDGLMYSQVDLIVNDGLVSSLQAAIVATIPHNDSSCRLYTRTIVIQTGGHDLTFRPPRMLVQDNNTILAVIDMLKWSIDYISSFNCSWKKLSRPLLTIVIVSSPASTMTYEPRRAAYAANSNIRASNQFIKLQLDRVITEISSSKNALVSVKYVDMYGITAPLVFHQTNIYSPLRGSFLAHPIHSSMMVATPPGKVSLGRVLNELCDIPTQSENVYNGKVIAAVPLSDPREYDMSVQEFDGKRIYIVQYGIKRAIPDLETFFHLGLNFSNVLNISSEAAANLPEDIPMLSRKNGFVYKIYAEGDLVQYYCVNDGVKRSFPKCTVCDPNRLYIANIHVNNAILAAYHDLELIPDGPVMTVAEALDGLPVKSDPLSLQIYFITKGMKRLIPNIDTFYYLGLKSDTIMYVDDADLSGIKIGDPYPACTFPCA